MEVLLVSCCHAYIIRMSLINLCWFKKIPYEVLQISNLRMKRISPRSLMVKAAWESIFKVSIDEELICVSSRSSTYSEVEINPLDQDLVYSEYSILDWVNPCTNKKSKSQDSISTKFVWVHIRISTSDKPNRWLALEYPLGGFMYICLSKNSWRNTLLVSTW